MLNVLFAQQQAGLINGGRDLVAALALHVGEQLGDIVQIVLGEMPGNRNDRIGRTVIVVHIVVHRLGVDRLQGFRRAKDRTAQRRACIAFLKQLINGDVFRGVLVHIDLLQYDTALQLDILLCKTGMHKHIRQNGDAGFETLVQHLHIIAGAFLIGKGVGLSAQCVDSDSDVLGRALFRAFEDHVLDEM